MGPQDEEEHASIGYPSVEWLRKHVGHEIQYLAFASAEFKKSREHEVPLQDSALVRARSLIEFFTDGGKRSGAWNFNKPGIGKKNTSQSDDWYPWICERLAHLDNRRETERSHDQWPHVETGVDKGPDRIQVLAEHVFSTIENRIPNLCPSYGGVLRELLQLARTYLRRPTQTNLTALNEAVVPPEST